MSPVPEEAGGGGGEGVAGFGALLVSTRRLDVVAPAGLDESTIVLDPTTGVLEEPCVMTTTLHNAWIPFPAWKKDIKEPCGAENVEQAALTARLT